jgi:hypothetical protein
MKKALAIVEQIIKEHQRISAGITASERFANDLVALGEFEGQVEGFVQNRLDSQKQHVAELLESVEKINKMLYAHFHGEETRLVKAFEDMGDEMLTNALSVLLEEHNEIRPRLAKLKASAVELSGSFSREVWEGKAYAVRAYIRHTQRLIEAHVETETDLLNRMKQKLETS